MNTSSLQKNRHAAIRSQKEALRRRLEAVLLSCCVLILLLTASFVDAAKMEDLIPQDSFFYLKLQDIDEIYNEIETSEDWEKVFGQLSETPAFGDIQQGAAMVQGILGTDLLSIIESIGYRTAMTLWSNTDDALQIGVIIHSGGNRGELQRLIKIVEGFVGMGEANTLHRNAGKYRKVHYNLMELEGQNIKYGFVDDFLIAGAGDGAFEKLLDTLKKEAPSIAENTRYAHISQKSRSAQVSLFCDVQQTLNGLSIERERTDLNDLEEIIIFLEDIKLLEVLFGELDLLESGKFFTLHGQFTQHAIEQLHDLYPNLQHRVKAANPFKTVKAVSTEEDLFVAISPVVSEFIWQLLSKSIAEETDGGTHTTVSFFENLLKLNLEEDIIPGLTGELAISVHDLAELDPSTLENLEIGFDGALRLDAEGINTQGALIFDASNAVKWNQLNNSVSNLHDLAVSRNDYNGLTVSTFATNMHYSEVDGLSILGFSTEQIHALIDEIRNSKRSLHFKETPESTVAVAQLNVARALVLEKEPPPPDRVLVNPSEASPLLAWISVKEEEASLEMTLSRSSTALEALARLIPFFIWRMEQQ